MIKQYIIYIFLLLAPSVCFASVCADFIATKGGMVCQDFETVKVLDGTTTQTFDRGETWGASSCGGTGSTSGYSTDGVSLDGKFLYVKATSSLVTGCGLYSDNAITPPTSDTTWMHVVLQANEVATTCNDIQLILKAPTDNNIGGVRFNRYPDCTNPTGFKIAASENYGGFDNYVEGETVFDLATPYSIYVRYTARDGETDAIISVWVAPMELSDYGEVVFNLPAGAEIDALVIDLGTPPENEKFVSIALDSFALSSNFFDVFLLGEEDFFEGLSVIPKRASPIYTADHTRRCQ